MRSVIVEDDYLQADWLRQVLEERFPGIKTQRLRSENEFRSNLEAMRNSPPDFILLDVMLRWTLPDDNVPPPEDVSRGKFYRAGLRCERLLREIPETQKLPVILYTMLDQTDLEPELQMLSGSTRYIGKSSDTYLLFDALLKMI